VVGHGKILTWNRVLELVRAGKTDQEIAGKLNVSVRTFRSFRKVHGIASAKGHG